MSEGQVRAKPQALGYTALCGLALGAIALVQIHEGIELFGMLLVVVALVGLLTRLRVTPLVVLLFLAVEQFRRQQLFAEDRGLSLDPMDLLRAGAVTAFIMGHFRLQGVVKPLVPSDARLPVAPPRQPRGEELSAFVVLTLLAAIAGELAWLELEDSPRVLGIPEPWGRLVLAAWLGAIGLGLAAAALGHWRRRQMTSDEASLYLQDVVWRQTRADQRRIQRHAVRRRGQR